MNRPSNEYVYRQYNLRNKMAATIGLTIGSALTLTSTTTLLVFCGMPQSGVYVIAGLLFVLGMLGSTALLFIESCEKPISSVRRFVRKLMFYSAAGTFMPLLAFAFLVYVMLWRPWQQNRKSVAPTIGHLFMGKLNLAGRQNHFC